MGRGLGRGLGSELRFTALGLSGKVQDSEHLWNTSKIPVCWILRTQGIQLAVFCRFLCLCEESKVHTVHTLKTHLGTCFVPSKWFCTFLPHQ